MLRLASDPRELPQHIIHSTVLGIKRPPVVLDACHVSPRMHATCQHGMVGKDHQTS